jgi:uncharacterized protein YecE (DUF72 family)
MLAKNRQSSSEATSVTAARRPECVTAVRLHIGTSGWEYAHWNRRFYPRGTADRLDLYAEHFRTVEVSGTFYRLPETRTFADWARRTPDRFIVALKASRFLTHVRRLRQPKAPTRRLLSRADGLGSKLGPILLQLPPSFAPDADLLSDALDAFGDLRVAVEFRDARWYTDDTRGVLESHDAALCIADRGSRLITPPWRTAS